TLFAGPAMNFVLAFVLFTLLFYINGKPTEEPVVGVVADDTPAEDAGLEEGDRLLTINGTEVDSWDHMSQIMQNEGESELDIVVQNEGEERTLEMTPVVDTTELHDAERVTWMIIGIGGRQEQETFSTLWWGV